jgi:kynurenine 3-monooxygenase
VTTTAYHLRKLVDDIFYGFTSRKAALLDELVPVLTRQTYPSRQSKSWIPLYTMVTFRPDISYANAKRRAKQQTKLLSAFSWTGILLSSSVVALMVKIMGSN